ncbi:hypothetical protein B566_EDAN002992 [Ephemera danica]|nr:hypothetical protein B566_EDAN002992 [Ephemera danica]
MFARTCYGNALKMDFSTSRLLESQSHNLATNHTAHILTDEQRKSFKGLVLVAQNLAKTNKLRKQNLTANVAKIQNLPLEVLWWYHSSGKGMEAAITIDFLTALCCLVYGPDPPPSLKETRKAATIILQSIIRKQLAAIKLETGTIWWLQKMVEPTHPVPLIITKKFAMVLLRLQLTEPPYISVHQALARQSEWTFSRAPKILASFFSNVFKAVQPPSLILDILMTVLQKEYEVNWKAVLICVSTFLQKLPDTAILLTDLITRSIVKAFSNENKELLLTSFLIARQCSLEGPGVGCLTYPIWFKKSFGIRSTVLATTLSHWRFLLDFLSQLVPHEPAAFLKAHIDQENQVKFDVESALSYFKSTEKIHKAIFEGSMFKKKYFEQHFLPALLKPRVLPSTNDAQMLFIDKLLSAGKISSVQYNNYHAQCLAASSSNSHHKQSEPELMILE